MKLSMRNFYLGALAALVTLPAKFVVAADTRIDVSQIIDKAQAESILGEKVKDPSPRNAEGKDGYYSKCNYYSAIPGKSLVIRLLQSAPDAINPLKELELVAASGGAMTPVEGLGDKAQMSSGGGDSGLASHFLMLYIAKGNAFITVGISGMNDETVALEKAKSVAQKLLEHL